MKITLVTDAWLPQVNGVVTTLVELVKQIRAAGHTVEVIEPSQFKTRPCPGYAGIDLAIRPGSQVKALLNAQQPEALHIATEGPLGWAARRTALQNGWAFTTAFHTKFPEILQAAIKVPLWLGYAWMRHFHRPSSGIMVPTQSVLKMLSERGFQRLQSWTHGVDTSLFDFKNTPEPHPLMQDCARPIHLYVGRVSYEKNIQAFLNLDLPEGSKVVCGEGPVREQLQHHFPTVKWLGIFPREQLGAVYAGADVLVFPSKADTFGLVMLEAMASGTPVAALPSDGPTEVIANQQGGAIHPDLKRAIELALETPRLEARLRAEAFTWAVATQQFLTNLVPTQGQALRPNL
jgi:glycosyltransferase involved in cell wall biosynthesis